MSAALRLGTRASQLALVQAEAVAARLRGAGHDVELVHIVTAGDRRPDGLSAQEGWFTTALRRALASGEIDLAVHSAKDLPVEEVPATAFVFPERADARDVLLTRRRTPLADLPEGATVGTDSPRRAGFLAAHRPDLRVRPLHGNVPTRIAKLERGDVDALVLAMAGLDRLGLASRVDEVLEPELIPPAPGQGALAIETLDHSSAVGTVIAALDDAEVREAVAAERALLAAMGGGCRSPLGALATVEAGELRLLAGVPGTLVRRSAPPVERDQLIDDVRRALTATKEEV